MRVHCLEWIGLPAWRWSVGDLRDRLSSLISKANPHIVYAPSRVDFHPEHLAVAHALALALEEVATPAIRDRRIRVYQIQVPLTRVLVNLVADVSALQRQCESVLRTYASQAGSIESTYRLRRYGAASHRLAGRVEEFWELTQSQFVALHRQSPADWPRAFRGLRNFPLTDPLAFLVGRCERHRIRPGPDPGLLHTDR